jgi:serine protease Do
MFLILLIMLLTFTGCPTIERKREPSIALTEVIEKEIRNKIDKGELSGSFQYISMLDREAQGVPENDVKKLYDEVISKLGTAFDEKIKAKNYYDSYTIFVSLKNIGKADLLKEWSENKLLNFIAIDLEANGNKVSALLEYLKILKNGNVSDTDLSKMLKLSSELENRKAMALIIPEMEKRNLPVDATYGKQAQTIPLLTDLMKGMAVIWVDKGIKIEKGMGIPDIVLGSGFFIDKRGYLITNHHVIESEVNPEYEGFSKLYIKLPSNINEKIPAKVIGYDRLFDIALLKVEISPQYVYPVADPVTYEVGEKVSAIGAPLGLENTVTSGIVSNVSRRFIQIGDVLQVDAPVNPGNSGGPLLNEKYDLLGVVFAGVPKFEGLNFAIPFNWINKIIPRLFTTGEVMHSWLGMSLFESEKGLEVVYTVPDEPAFNGRIRAGDIIESLNGKQYKTIRDIQEALLGLDENTLVQVSWIRKDKKMSGFFSTSKRPFSPFEIALDRDSRDSVLLPLFGLEIEAVDNVMWETNYKIIKVIQGSIADNSGISVDDTLNIQNWIVDKKNRIAIMQLFIKKRTSGFFESTVQLAAYLESETFI